MTNWLTSMFGTVGLGFAFCIPLLLVAGVGLFFVLFPEVASKRTLRRRGFEAGDEAAGRVCRRRRILGVILLCAAFVVLVAIVISAWLGLFL